MLRNCVNISHRNASFGASKYWPIYASSVPYFAYVKVCKFEMWGRNTTHVHIFHVKLVCHWCSFGGAERKWQEEEDKKECWKNWSKSAWEIPCKKPYELYFMEISKWRLTFGNVLLENCDAQICHDKCYGVRYCVVVSQTIELGDGREAYKKRWNSHGYLAASDYVTRRNNNYFGVFILCSQRSNNNKKRTYCKRRIAIPYSKCTQTTIWMRQRELERKKNATNSHTVMAIAFM